LTKGKRHKVVRFLISPKKIILRWREDDNRFQEIKIYNWLKRKRKGSIESGLNQM
jgi:hypothetical protein